MIRLRSAGRAAVLAVGCLPVAAQVLAITGAVVYPGGGAAAVSPATVLARDGRIVAVGKRVRIPAGAEVIRCDGCAIVAGFWNGHVHFTEPKWDGAGRQPAPALGAQLEAMLTRSGFSTVVDTGSLLANTVALRRRIETGEVAGPRILTAGVPLYPPDGIPYYVKDALPAEILPELAGPADAAQAAAGVEARIGQGADLIKLFTGSWIARGMVLPMPGAIAKAAVEAAHRRGRVVFSHSSNLAGTRVAMESGVDVLAHAPESTGGIDDALLRRAAARGMYMIPTLMLFGGNDNIGEIRRLVRRFHELGGRLVFGTDTGYLTDPDVSGEFAQLSAAGFRWAEILAMLTENPARLFGEERVRGRVVRGMAADLTVLGADPAVEAGAFSKVRFTIRAGRVVYRGR